MKINSGILSALSLEGILNSSLGKSIRRLSLGLSADSVRCGSAKRTAAILDMDRTSRHLQDRLTLYRTADVALKDVQSVLTHVREASAQVFSGVADISKKFEPEGWVDQIKSIVKSASFCGRPVFGDAGVLREKTNGSVISFADIHASADIHHIDEPIGKVAAQRAVLHAYMGEAERVGLALGTRAANVSAADSRIADMESAGKIIGDAQRAILMQPGRALRGQSSLSPGQIRGLMCENRI